MTRSVFSVPFRLMLVAKKMMRFETDSNCYSYIIPGLGDFGDRYYSM